MPYINGFIMAIRSLIQTFASFLGYKMPDSTGLIDDVLAGYGDEMDNFGSSVDDTNESLGGTAEKLKEIEGQLASFDKLNVIQPPTDNSSGGSGGGGAGGGFGGIDSRLLDALNNMNYKFQEADMLANKIRDRLLEWADILGNKINDNIFEPIQNSWDKYGIGISFDFESTLDNVKLLFLDFFTITGRSFKENFQSWTDLFFSLLETAGIVANSISDALLMIWLHGGRDLWDSLGKLTTSIVNLATSINDNFVKPILKWFKNNILPIITEVLGKFAKLASNIISGLADIINWIAKTRPAVTLLASAVTTFILALSTAKLIKFINTCGGLKASIIELGTQFISNSKVVSIMFDSYTKLKGVFGILTTSISNFANRASAYLTTTSGMISSTENMTIAQTLASKATGALSTAFSFISTHPMIAVVAGLAAITAGIALFVSSIGDGNNSLDVINDKLDNLSKKTKESADSIDDLSERTLNSLKQASEGYSVQSKYLQDLIDMTGGSNGYVENIDKAKLAVDKVNEVCADSVTINEEGLIIWQKTPEAIKAVIDQLKQKAQIEVYEQQYKDALAEENDLRLQQAEAVRLQNEAQRLYNEEIDRVMKMYPDWNEETAKSYVNAGEYGIALKEANTQLKEANTNLATNKTQMENLDLAIDSTNGNMEARAQLLANEAILNKGVDASWTEMRNGLTLLGEQVKITTGEEQECYKNSRDILLSTYAEKMSTSASTYTKLLDDIKRKGVEMTAEDEKQLNDSYVRFKANKWKISEENAKYITQFLSDEEAKGIKFSETEQKYLAEIYENYDKYGFKSGEEFMENVKKELSDRNGVLNEAYWTALGIKGKIEEQTYEAKVKTSYDQTSLYNTKEAIKRGIANIGFGFSGSTGGSGGRINLVPYATGGLPSFGEMFIAREKGPEFVGRWGSKNVVANNDQITEGVGVGVYNAILPLFQSLAEILSSNQDINITVDINDDYVEKKVEKANKSKMLKTGKPLFNK